MAGLPKITGAGVGDPSGLAGFALTVAALPPASEHTGEYYSVAADDSGGDAAIYRSNGTTWEQHTDAGTTPGLDADALHKSALLELDGLTQTVQADLVELDRFLVEKDSGGGLNYVTARDIGLSEFFVNRTGFTQLYNVPSRANFARFDLAANNAAVVRLEYVTGTNPTSSAKVWNFVVTGNYAGGLTRVVPLAAINTQSAVHEYEMEFEVTGGQCILYMRRVLGTGTTGAERIRISVASSSPVEIESNASQDSSPPAIVSTYPGVSSNVDEGYTKIFGGFARDTQRTAVSATFGDVYRMAVTDTSVVRVITVPSDQIAIVDREFEVTDESGGAGTNNITVATAGAETIDGAPSLPITVDHGVLRLYSDGTNLFTR